MSLFQFFKRNKKRPLRGNYDKLNQFLEDHIILENHRREGFFVELFNSFIREVDDDENPDYKTFREEFQQANKAQDILFSEMIVSNFETGITEKFLLNYKHSIDSTYTLPSTNILLISYWDKILKKLKEEIESGVDYLKRKGFEPFYNRFEKITREEFDRLTKPAI